MASWAQLQLIEQPIQPIGQQFFSLSYSALKKLSWDAKYELGNVKYIYETYFLFKFGK